ncbi:hypothetical protein [Halanaeroarchaeum sulfurireducens]|uniref:Uncharacterized protein n=1 Tax=Halanaeroarchaeum sulfurireducens TaxID=1604004 RepID=A0A0F7P8S9_9EURY|nr:hypothetical protein [Halanaeroarchaeum sulfurireducens]AKH96635.1 hypothetical protein HLASF_0121 [Halanaeroarchaeum sulfurireducens]ALG81037.1 hypothetical protein HLASA_0121 [Halanaeroarchaeum sulfurireducens]
MVALGGVEFAYIATSVVLSAAGLSMVGLAVHAYVTAQRQEMLFLAIGFALVVAAAIATTVSAFLNGFSNIIVLLTVHNAIATAGYAFVIYSVIR